MPKLARLFNFVNGGNGNADDFDSEFNQIVNFLAGISTTIYGEIRLNDSSIPPLILDQLGAGLIAEFRQNGSAKVQILNTGNILVNAAAPTVSGHLTRKDYVDGKKIAFSWEAFYAGAVTTASKNRQYITPQVGSNYTVRTLKASYSSGTPGGTTTINVKKNGVSIGTIDLLVSTGTDVIVENDIADAALAANDVISFVIDADGGHDDLTVAVIGDSTLDT